MRDGAAPRPRRWRAAWADLDRHNLSNGIVAFLFAATGALAVLLAVANQGGLSEALLSSWIFAAYGLGGLLTVGFSLAYRQPLALAWTIPGAVLVGPALARYPFSDIVGAYCVSGALLLLLGASGGVRRVMDWVPTPIVMGMVAGVFMPFVLDLLYAFEDAFWLAVAMVAAFLALQASPARRQVPPILAALLAGAALLLLRPEGLPREIPPLALVEPVLTWPRFSLDAIAELSLPLTLTVVGIQNAQGFFILRQAGFRPPENALTLGCGAGSLMFAVLGSVPTCVTGPSNAMLNLSGRPESRYMGGVVFGLAMLLFGLFAPFTAGLSRALPGAFIAVLGGLALLGVLQSSMTSAFAGRCALGALVAFLVTLSDIAIFGIGAAFWGLVFGCAVSWLLEREAMRAGRAEP